MKYIYVYIYIYNPKEEIIVCPGKAIRTPANAHGAKRCERRRKRIAQTDTAG